MQTEKDLICSRKINNYTACISLIDIYGIHFQKDITLQRVAFAIYINN